MYCSIYLFERPAPPKTNRLKKNPSPGERVMIRNMNTTARKRTKRPKGTEAFQMEPFLQPWAYTASNLGLQMTWTSYGDDI